MPTIEITPIRSGMPAATTPRKTKSSRSARIGKAISSALVRSARVWSLVSLKPGGEAAQRDVERVRRGQRLDTFGDDPARVLDVGGREVD